LDKITVPAAIGAVSFTAAKALMQSFIFFLEIGVLVFTDKGILLPATGITAVMTLLGSTHSCLA
jgi:hypothetical protein